ncbi:MAG: histidine kinase [Bacillota bacterium]|nr:histidine kinase [Bacillota bacterium]
MGKRTKTIQLNLFFTYSMIIIMVLVIFVSFLYFWISNLLRDKAFESISNLSASTSDKLDAEIQKLDYVSMNVLYSSAVKNRFVKYTNEWDKENNTTNQKDKEQIDYINNTKELIDVLFTIIGPNRPVQQIYLYDFNGRAFGTGTDNRQQNIPVNKKTWFKEVMKKNGKKYISQPMKDEELEKFAAQSESTLFISLCRVYFGNYNEPQGIIEAKQYYDEIFKSVQENMSINSNKESIYVYDNNGNIMYPLRQKMTKMDTYYFNLKNSTTNKVNSITANNPFSNKRELINYKYSNYTGWTTVVVVSENKLLAPVFDFARILLLTTLGIFLLALIVSYFAAKKITNPISQLNKAIKEFNLGSPIADVTTEHSSDLNELEDLNQAFNKMNIKLKKSHIELMLSQKHEMQSRMLALQSQMNPHFLYNTLSTISVMAEESMDEQIVELCSNVSDLLRYISSDKSPLVELKTEIQYTEKYLSSMKFRYGNKLTYSIEIEEEMKKVKIPKLLIQPIVENALKYGTRKEPPWNIKVRGHMTNTFWQVSVQDNGAGFDLEKLNGILKSIEELDRSVLLPSLEIEGMGLLNIYMRLKLYYKNQMIFHIGNHVSGGAMITIGGSL